MDKWTSRKLRLTGCVIGLISLIPIVYKFLSIGESVTLAVIVAVGGASGVYNVANALSKRSGVDGE